MKPKTAWKPLDENNLCYVNIGRAIKTIKTNEKKTL
jgi:hypothetical protein